MLKSSTFFFVLGLAMILITFVTAMLGINPAIYLGCTLIAVFSILWGLVLAEENPDELAQFLMW